MMAIKQVQTRPMPKNLPLEIWYRKKLVASVRAMAKDLEKSVEAQYKRKQPRMAADMSMDASPAVDMAALLRHMRYKWKNHFSKLAKTVPKLFAKRAERDASARLKSVLKECGFTVDFKLTPRLNDILQSSIAENVGLIKTIQSQYFDQIETIVMQAVKNGRDLGYLHKELRKRYGVSEGRATVIARDQTNKANEAVSRERTLQTGLTKATWFHIGGKYSDRSTHAKMHGREFDLREGLYDSAVGRDVLPAELINCNCSYRIVVPDIGQGGTPPVPKVKPKQVLPPKEYSPTAKTMQDYTSQEPSPIKAAKAFFDANLRNTFVKAVVEEFVHGENISKNIDAVFTGGTWQKFKMNLKHDAEKLLLMEDVPSVLKTKGKKVELYKNREDFNHFYEFTKDVVKEINGKKETYIVKVQVGAHKENKSNVVYHYKQEKALDSMTPAGLLSGQATPTAFSNTSNAFTNNAAYSGLLSGQATPEASRYSNALASDASKKKLASKFAIVNIIIIKKTCKR